MSNTAKHANGDASEIKTILTEILGKISSLEKRVYALEKEADCGDKQLVLSNNQMNMIVPILRDNVMREVMPVISDIKEKIEYLSEDTSGAIHADRMVHLGVNPTGHMFLNRIHGNQNEMLSGTMWGENF